VCDETNLIDSVLLQVSRRSCASKVAVGALEALVGVPGDAPHKLQLPTLKKAVEKRTRLEEWGRREQEKKRWKEMYSATKDIIFKEIEGGRTRG